MSLSLMSDLAEQNQTLRIERGIGKYDTDLKEFFSSGD
jgi:hypothetical protein